MLLELAIGDAYGAGFEYAPQLATKFNNAERYTKHPRHETRPGEYTDDTQMSLAIAEALVSGERWTPLNLAARFVECFHRDPRTGYAGAFHAFLTETHTGEDFLRKIRPHSDKSGAAMRAGPLGILPTIGTVLEYARIQAAITHNTPDGIHAAQAAALMPHYFLYEHGPKKKLGQFLESQVPGNWNAYWPGKVKSKGWMSVTAAVTAVTECDSLVNLLKRCISFGGDVDTVATIAMAAASCSNEYDQTLPDTLVFGLECGEFGREYIVELDRKLMAMRPDSGLTISTNLGQT